MTRAKLHISCGNSGSKDMFKYRIVTEIDDDTNEKYQRVSINCENCSTINCLEDNAEKE